MDDGKNAKSFARKDFTYSHNFEFAILSSPQSALFQVVKCS
jgi:hypothetical protein